MPRVSRALSPTWDASDTPEENFGSDEDAEWPVDGIVGEDVDPLFTHRYEVRWKNWQRKDGSNTTWMKDHGDFHLLKPWKRQMKRQQAYQADQSQAISLRSLSHAPLHGRNTAELSEAHHEKLMKSLSGHPEDNYSCWDEEIEAQLASHPQVDEDGTGENRPKRGLRTKSRRITQASQYQMPQASSSKSRQALDHDTPDVEDTPCILVQKQWNQSIRESGGGAPIFVVNNYGNDIPDVPEDFTYCEQGYLYPGNYYMPDADVIVCCMCTETCEDAQSCDCQGPSELEVNGVKTFAYTSLGLFAFNVPPGTAIIECNQYCNCNSTCPNRVAQRPRDVPMEVFKTKDCGWGVRATSKIVAGKVLGCFSGKLITREEAQNTNSEYIFDLDALENFESESEFVDAESYSVDAHHEGNWTRFINHSCEPNCKFYPVCYDNIPESNTYYLACVALKDIPARTELTLDYNPLVAEIHVEKKGKGKAYVQNRPEGTRECFCGTDSCRGYLWA